MAPLLVLIPLLLAYVAYRRLGRPGERTFRLLGALIGWVMVGLSLVIASVLQPPPPAAAPRKDETNRS